MDKELNEKSEIGKLTEENIVNNLHDIGVGKDFLNRHCLPQNLGQQLANGTFIKLESISTVKQQQQKNQLNKEGVYTLGSNICQLYI